MSEANLTANVSQKHVNQDNAGAIVFYADYGLKNATARIDGLGAMISAYLKNLANVGVLSEDDLFKNEILGVQDVFLKAINEEIDELTSIKGHIVGCRTYQKRGVKMDNTDKIEILNQALENLEGAQTLLLALARYLRENAYETANALFVIEGTIFQNVSDLKSVFEDELTAYAKI